VTKWKCDDYTYLAITTQYMHNKMYTSSQYHKTASLKEIFTTKKSE